MSRSRYVIDLSGVPPSRQGDDVRAISLDDAEALAYDKNPIDNLAPLAKAKVPLLHVYGDADEVVPWDENTGIIAERYPKLGGEIQLIAKPGVGHHPHGLDDPTPIVEFIVKHSTAK